MEINLLKGEWFISHCFWQFIVFALLFILWQSGIQRQALEVLNLDEVISVLVPQPYHRNKNFNVNVEIRRLT